MKRTFDVFVCSLVLIISLTACGTSPGSQAEPPSSEPSVDKGSWELLSEDYNPVTYDICKTISFPKFQEKTREEWEDYSISIGKIDAEFITWAAGGLLSPDQQYLVYASNKDCIEIDGAMSIFLLDMYSYKEKVLLSGRDGSYYWALNWLDEETLLCSFTSNETIDNPPVQHLICNIKGKATPLSFGELTWPFPFSTNGNMIVYLMGPKGESINLVRIEKDGSILKLAQKDLDGYAINNGGISPDGKWVVFPLRTSMGDDPSRLVCLWNTQNGSTSTLENPIPNVGRDIAAISVKWKGDAIEVNFNIQNAPDANGHNELWRYIF